MTRAYRNLGLFGLVIVAILAYCWNEAETRDRYDRMIGELQLVKTAMSTVFAVQEKVFLDGEACTVIGGMSSGGHERIVYKCKAQP